MKTELPQGQKFGVPKRKKGVEKVSATISIEKTLYLHAKEHFNIPLTVEASLRAALAAEGVDPSRPHASEVWSAPDPNDLHGKPVTWGDARRMRYVDENDRPAGGLGDEAPESEGAVL